MVKITPGQIFTTQRKSRSLHQNFPFRRCPSNTIWKTLACLTYQSQSVEIISTDFLV